MIGNVYISIAWQLSFARSLCLLILTTFFFLPLALQVVAPMIIPLREINQRDSRVQAASKGLLDVNKLITQKYLSFTIATKYSNV
jgi:hypothetical protein